MVTLPDKTTRMYRSFTVTDTYADVRGDFGVECLWGTDEAPAAVLRITAPQQMAYTWCKVGIHWQVAHVMMLCVWLRHLHQSLPNNKWKKPKMKTTTTTITTTITTMYNHLPFQGLRHGFALEFDVANNGSSMAELCLDLQPSGHWFGGGHFMRQLWPLDAASWETGPFYPFDNGPNGLNTLVSPQWMTRCFCCAFAVLLLCLCCRFVKAGVQCIIGDPLLQPPP